MHIIIFAYSPLFTPFHEKSPQTWQTTANCYTFGEKPTNG